MAYKLDREKAVAALQFVFDRRDERFLTELYQYAALHARVSQPEILQLWHGFKPLACLDTDVLIDLLKFCIEKHGGIGRFQDYILEEDSGKNKLEYISTIQNPKTKYAVRQWLNAFDATIVETYGKDLPQVTRQEAIAGLTALQDVSVSSLRQALTVARNYCDWCIKNGKYGGAAANPFRDIAAGDIPIEDWVRQNVIPDDKALSSGIRAQFTIDDGYLAPVILVLAWMGFTMKEMLSIRKEEVSTLEGTIAGRTVPGPLRDIISSYAAADIVYRENGFGAVQYQAEDLGYFLKRMVSKPSGKQLRLLDLNNAQARLERLNYSRVYLSGKLSALRIKEGTTGALMESDFAETFHLDRGATSYLSRLKDKRRLYAAYRSVYG